MATAALDVSGTNLGFLPPRNTDPNANITGPATGLMAYDSTDNALQYFNGTSWVSLTGGATPAGANTQVQFNNSGALGASANFTWASDTLTVTGDILFTGIMRDLSDARRKENITRITGALDKVNALDGVSFIMKDDPNRAVELGLIAQDVEKVFPELVITTSDGTMALNYQGMVGPLVEAVKELDTKNTELRAALDALSSRIDALEGKRQPRSRSGNYRFNQ